MLMLRWWTSCVNGVTLPWVPGTSGLNGKIPAQSWSYTLHEAPVMFVMQHRSAIVQRKFCEMDQRAIRVLNKAQHVLLS